MNNRHRHIKYRQNVYKKNRIKFIFIISAVVLAVLLCTFLVIGNVLHKKTLKGPLDSDTNGTYTPEKEENSALEELGAYALPLLENGSSFSQRLSSLKVGANAACIALNTPDGEILYRTQLDNEIQGLDVAADASSLSGILSQTNDRELYLTAMIYLPPYNGENLSSDILLNYDISLWTALAEEALWGSIYNRSDDPDDPKQPDGVNDVLFVARTATHDDLSRLIAIADTIHSSNEAFTVGILIPDSVLTGKDSVRDIEELSKHFDYMALDTTIDKEDNMLANIENRINGLYIELLHYKMRVLLPSSTAADERDQYIDKVTKLGIKYWQIQP